jgi:hypothetical protein
MNFCKDCKWSLESENWWVCAKPRINIVSGDTYATNQPCSWARQNNLLCGEEGRWFEPKETQ